jgi:putative protease
MLDCKLPELLAPVSSLENVQIAIFAGANAIYFGGKKYGLRTGYDYTTLDHNVQNNEKKQGLRNDVTKDLGTGVIKNLSFDEIEKAVRISHLYNVKVYLTVNTLIKEEEFVDVVKYVVNLYKIGVDAVIVQDVGLIKAVKDIIPNFNICGSTQLNIHNSLGLIWAINNGIKRVVLSRQLEYTELKNLSDFAKSIQLELEIFIHGSYCFSYSGSACSFSFFSSGKNAQEGTCTRPCRQKYKIAIRNSKKSIKNNEDYSYLLSLKDMALYSALDELLDLNIDSFKIEGRTRNKDYLATVVNSYRQALDKRKYKVENFNEKDLIAIENLKLVFNRQYSKGYLFDKEYQNLMNTKRVAHNGLYIGKIEKDDPEKITIKLKHDLLYQIEIEDSLIIENNNKYIELDILTKPILKGKTLIIKKLDKDKKLEIILNSKVYITNSKSRTQFVHDLVNDEHLRNIEKSKIDIEFYIDKENYPVLTGFISLANGKKLTINKKSNEPWQLAQNKTITKEDLKEQFLKVEKFPFIISSINFNYDENFFADINQINKFRQDFFSEINDLIVNSYLPKDINLVDKKLNSYLNNSDLVNKNEHELKLINEKNNLSIYINDLNILKLINKNNFNFKRIYLEIPYGKNNFNKKAVIDIDYMVQFIKEAVNILKDSDYELVWKLQDIAHEELKNEFIKAINILNELNIKISLMTGFLGLDIYLRTNKQNLNILGSKYIDIYNATSFLNLKDYSILTLKPELSIRNMGILADKYNTFIVNKNDKKLPKPEIIVAGNLEIFRSKVSISDLDTPDEIFLENLKGNLYPIKKDIQGNSNILLNKEDLSLFKDIQFLKSKLIKNFALDCRWKSFDHIKILYDYYKIAIEKDLSELETEELYNKLKQELKKKLSFD